MKITMLRFYHGVLNGGEKWFAGETLETTPDVAKSLVERGFAEYGSEPAPTATKEASASKPTSPRKRKVSDTPTDA